MTVRTAIVDRPIIPSALLEEVEHPGHGAAVLFIGNVRDVNDAKPVTGIDYSAYREMAERELARIANEASNRFPELAVVVEHRVGTLRVGETSVAIATGHPHRGAAYEANRFVIEELKRRLPVWKREHYVDGSRDWVAGSGSPA
jgi:molybdopterin synthase catalytic subunit